MMGFGLCKWRASRKVNFLLFASARPNQIRLGRDVSLWPIDRSAVLSFCRSVVLSVGRSVSGRGPGAIVGQPVVPVGRIGLISSPISPRNWTLKRLRLALAHMVARPSRPARPRGLRPSLLGPGLIDLYDECKWPGQVPQQLVARHCRPCSFSVVLSERDALGRAAWPAEI